MNHRVLSALLCTVALVGCATTPRAAPTLAGQWAPVSAQLAGQDFPVASFAGATLQLTADTYAFGGDRGNIVVLPGSAPAQMDILGREGPNAGRTVPAIYALAGDELTVCYQLGPGARPSEFTSPPGSQILLIHYRRVRS